MLHATRRYDFVVAGGGMAGIAAALAAARRGLLTALVQDRPVLGGNGSKEVRVWLHGANGSQNNRFFRETGLVEELRLENLYRNPLGSAELWDTVLLEKVYTQPNLDLFLNTAVTSVRVEEGCLRSLGAFTLASEREWTFEAPLFADCTGDGAVAFLAGAEFRTGREAEAEHRESLAPQHPEPYTLGGTILFAVKDVGRPVPFVAPSWAHRLSEEELRFRRHSTEGAGSEYWWMEYGGELDTIHDNEAVKWELLKIVYGMFDHLKNTPEHAAAMATYTLEWVGTIPGKRESRRFLGDHVLTQADVLDQPPFEDAVAVGGWNIDHHPAKGFWSPEPPSYHFHIPGVYNIPFRCLYSRTLENLLLAGRNISATHVAMCSTRVMLTGAQMGEAAGAAAFHCRREGCRPRDLVDSGIYGLQQDLLRADHYILGVPNDDPGDLARAARITESSSVEAALEAADGEEALDRPRALMLPLAGKLDHISLRLRSDRDTSLRYALHGPDPKGNFAPGAPLFTGIHSLGPAAQHPAAEAWSALPAPLDDAEPGFYWLLLDPAEGVRVATTPETLVGVLSFAHEPAWAPHPGPWRFDEHQRNVFSPWRKLERNYCFRTDSWIPAFYGGDQVANRFSRAHRTPNIWISSPTDFALPEWLEFAWETPVELGSIHLYFNTDLDRDLRNIWTEYELRAIPECIRDYRLFARAESARAEGEWKEVFAETGNYHRHRVHHFPTIRTTKIRLEVTATNGHPRAEIYEVRLYGPEA